MKSSIFISIKDSLLTIMNDNMISFIMKIVGKEFYFDQLVYLSL